MGDAGEAITMNKWRAVFSEKGARCMVCYDGKTEFAVAKDYADRVADALNFHDAYLKAAGQDSKGGAHPLDDIERQHPAPAAPAGIQEFIAAQKDMTREQRKAADQIAKEQMQQSAAPAGMPEMPDSVRKLI